MLTNIFQSRLISLIIRQFKKLHCVERINKQGILLMYDTQKNFRNLPNTIFISTFEF